MENENQTKQDSGLPSRPLIGSTAAVRGNAERETHKHVCPKCSKSRLCDGLYCIENHSLFCIGCLAEHYYAVYYE